MFFIKIDVLSKITCPWLSSWFISRFYITIIVIKVQFVIRNDIININNFYIGPLNLVMFSRPKARCDVYLSDHLLDI